MANRLFTLILILLFSPINWAQDKEPLDPAIAFTPTGFLQADQVLTVQFDIVEGYYLYKHAFKFASFDDPITLGKVEIPAGIKKQDDWFGEVETYRNQVQINVPWAYNSEATPEIFFVEVTYQGCADMGLCYPPQKQLLQFSPNTTKSNNAKPSQAIPSSNTLSEQDQLAARLTQGISLITLISFFGFGLLLAFTPCVFPMIPILSGIIVGQGKSITTRKAFILSLVYVLAMAITYTVAGVIVGLSGENVQALFQNPWILSSFAAIFILLSFSMFGFYELQMPSAIQSRLTSISNNQQSGTLIGAAMMGLLSALIVGPCVTAPLIGALIYIAQTGDAILGGAALFSLSLGMGLPLVIIGTSAGKLIPKAGAWMDAVKAFFGIVLIAIAIWLLSRILPASITMASYAALLITSSIYLGALEPLHKERSRWFALWKGIGLIILIYGILLLIGAASDSGSMSQPLKGIALNASQNIHTEHDGAKFQAIKV